MAALLASLGSLFSGEAAVELNASRAARAVGKLKKDTAANATRRGQSAPVASDSQILSSIVGFASTVIDLVNFIEDREHNDELFRKKRYKLGITIPTENRLKLVLEGKIPAYYASDNIRRILKEGKIPIGWEETTLALQGFEKELSTAKEKEQQNTIITQLANRERIRVSQAVYEKAIGDINRIKKGKRIIQALSIQ